MELGLKMAQVAALVGDPARANMLAALMDGRALTASELAYVSGVAPQTTSGHLAKLAGAGLLAVEKQGRHRYYRLASALVGRMLELIMVFAQDRPAAEARVWRGGEALRQARTCYDHMAGRVAVAIADRLVEGSFVLVDADGGQLSDAGRVLFDRMGLDLGGGSKRRVFCRPCLDWSERRPHLAGAVGAAILSHALAQGWVERIRDSRALAVTGAGREGLGEAFGIGEALRRRSVAECASLFRPDAGMPGSRVSDPGRETLVFLALDRHAAVAARDDGIRDGLGLAG